MYKNIIPLIAFGLCGCSSFPIIDKISPVIVENVFQCSGGIVERSTLKATYNKVETKSKSGKEVLIALEKTLKANGITEANFDRYQSCINKLVKLQQKHKSTVSAVISDVVIETKYRTIDSKTVVSNNGEAFSDENITTLSDWILGYLPKEKEIRVNVNIPKKLEKNIDLNNYFSGIKHLNPKFTLVNYSKPEYLPPIEGQTTYSTSSILNGNPQIVPVEARSMIGGKRRDYVVFNTIGENHKLEYPLEIRVNVPGFYNPNDNLIKYELTGNNSINDRVTLKSDRLRIAIEKFSGKEHSVSEKLAANLSKNSNITILSTDQLRYARKNIAMLRSKKRSAAQRAIIKKGIDYIISGSVTTNLSKE